VLAALLVPAAVDGQSVAGAIAGTVRDTTGLALPGVVVEAASPALVDKTRRVTSDDDGRFQIADLQPGTYSVSFELPGFNVIKREGVAIPAATIATVNADLRLRVIGESFTLSGPAPTVEVRKVAGQKAVARTAIEAKSGEAESDRVAAMTPGAAAPVSPTLTNDARRIPAADIVDSQLDAAPFAKLLNRFAPVWQAPAQLIGRLAKFATPFDF
jgi:hypothetical protein